MAPTHAHEWSSQRIRMNLIELQKQLHGLDTGGAFQFFYDEANNFRKLKFGDEGFNNKVNSHFVVGGIVFENKPNLEQILKDSRVQNQHDEVKFKDFARGSLEQCLKSSKLRLFLKGLKANNVNIHYSITNTLYWAVVDIVDTILNDTKLYPFHDVYKTTLYIIAKKEESRLLKLFLKYEFPAVLEEQMDGFYQELQSLLQLHINDQHLTFHIQELNRLIKRARRKKDWNSLLDDDKGLLFQNDGLMYARNIVFFQNSSHVFDKEDQLEVGFTKKVRDYAKSEMTNYTFKDSKSSLAIQLSDVIVSTIARYHDFLDSHTPSKLRIKLNEMDKDRYQLETMKLLNDIINNSIKKNQAFIHNILPFTIHENLSIVTEHYSSQ